MESYHDFITHMPERTISLTIDPQQEEFSLYVIEQVVIPYWTESPVSCLRTAKDILVTRVVSFCRSLQFHAIGTNER